MSLQIKVPREEVVAFCERYNIVKLAFFGSVLRDDFGAESDIDVLVDIRSGAEHDISVILDMEKELGGILGREVDLVFRPDVEKWTPKLHTSRSRFKIRRGFL